MEAWWYWALFSLAAAIVIVVPLLYWLEDRAERRDKEAWREFMQRRTR